LWLQRPHPCSDHAAGEIRLTGHDREDASGPNQTCWAGIANSCAGSPPHPAPGPSIRVPSNTVCSNSRPARSCWPALSSPPSCCAWQPSASRTAPARSAAAGNAPPPRTPSPDPGCRSFRCLPPSCAGCSPTRSSRTGSTAPSCPHAQTARCLPSPPRSSAP